MWLLHNKCYNSGWWNTWSVEATKTVAKYERFGEPQRMRLFDHTSNAYSALPPFPGGPFDVTCLGLILKLISVRGRKANQCWKKISRD